MLSDKQGWQTFILPGDAKNFEVIMYFFDKIIFVKLLCKGGKFKSNPKK